MDSGELLQLLMLVGAALLTVNVCAARRNSYFNNPVFRQMMTRETWYGDHKLVNFMSIQMEKADLPNLPTLAGQLGLNSLVADVVKVGLTPALSGKGPLTVLGPTDAAFTTVPDWLKPELANDTILAAVLRFHVLKDRVLSSDISNEMTVKTLLEPKTSIRFNRYVNNMVTAQCAPLDSSVDNMASNGVLHKLKSVAVPPSGTIAEALSSCSIFETLASAVEMADLMEVLSGDGPFTLFAPTESAFQKLDPQTWDSVRNNKTALTDLLKYHVTTNTYCSAGLVFYKQLVMLNGEEVNITIEADKLKVNEAAVVPAGADGSVFNGVLHAIDAVLFPSTLAFDGV